MRSMASLGILVGLLVSPAYAQDSESAVLSPGAEAGDTLGSHSFVLTFEPTSIREAGLIRDKFEREAIFAEVLDELSAQIALPQDISVTFKDCGFPNAYWMPSEYSVTMCYELIQMYNSSYEALDDEAKSLFTWADQGSVVTGTTMFILLHELGHGLVSIFDLPITGREEDAVDQFATLTLIAADDEDDTLEDRPSRMALLGAYFFEQLAHAPDELSRRIFSDEHALGQQRYYDVMCLVLGSDFDTYAPVITPGLMMVAETWERNPDMFDQEKFMEWLNMTDELNILPAARALRCQNEFSRYDASWDYILDTFLTPQEN